MLSRHRFVSGVLLGAVSAHLAVAQSFFTESVRVVPWAPVAPGALTRAALIDLDADGLQDLVGLDGPVVRVALGVGYHRSFRPSIPEPVNDFALLGSTLYTVGSALQSWAYDPAVGAAPFTATLLDPANGSPWTGARRVLPIDLAAGTRGLAGVDAAGASVLIREGVQAGRSTTVVPLPSTVLDLAMIDDGTASPTVIAVTATALYRVDTGGATLIAAFPSGANEARFVSFAQAPGFTRIAALMKFSGHAHQQLFVYDPVLGFELPLDLPGLDLRGLVAADFDFDGDEDLIALHDDVSSGELQAIIFPNHLGAPGVTGTFPGSTNATIETGAAESNSGASVAIACGDVTNDGDLDLILPASDATELRVLENDAVAHEGLRLTLDPTAGVAGNLLYDGSTGALTGVMDVMTLFPGTTHVEVRLWHASTPTYDPQGALLPLELNAAVAAVVATVPLGSGTISIDLAPGTVIPGTSAFVLELTPVALDVWGAELARGPLQAFAAALSLALYRDFGPLYGAPSVSLVKIEAPDGLLNGRTEIGGITPAEEPPDFEDEDEVPPNPGGDGGP